MISKMTKYAFLLLSGEKEDFIARLQEIGLVDITRSEKPVDDKSRSISSELDRMHGLIQDLRQTAVPEGILPEEAGGKDLVQLAEETLMHYSETRGRIKALTQEVEARSVWGSFDPELVARLSDAGVPLHFHHLSAKRYQDDWEQDYALTEIARRKDGVWFVVAGEDPLPGEIPPPGGDVNAAESALHQEEETLRQLEGKILWLQQQIPLLEQRCSDGFSRLEGYLAGVSANPAAEDTIVTFTGYALTENEAALAPQLDTLDAYWFAEPATVEDTPPIALKNNRFVKMFEVLTDMYGRPSYDGFDPTPFLSVFFLLFFALCMGDAGYGIILIILGLLLRRGKSMKDLAPLVITLGAGTLVVGFFLHTFFSMNIAEWPLFAPCKKIFLPDKIAGYDGAMILSLVIGVVHVCLALIIKTVQATRNHGFLSSLGTWGWTLLIVGGVIVGGFALAGVIDAALTKWIIIGLGGVSALGIFLFNTPGRNPLINIGSGLWDTYNTATGLLGDVLSYLRLYALGLAGAMLGYAFNDLGKMILGDGTGVGNWIFFILILILGHTLNIAMCALGAFVHPLRLNFLEFFKNSGYEGNGRNFRPLSKNS